MKTTPPSLPFLAALVLTLIAAGRSSNGQTPVFRITGIVLNSVTGNPVPHTHLEASLAGRVRSPRAQSTNGTDADSRGRFTVNLPSAGTWHLTASAPGYVTQAYDAHGSFSSAVVLSTATPSVDLQFRLPPQGRITGTVLDEAGEAVRNATVGLLIQTIARPAGTGGKDFLPRGAAMTDDRGVYEFSGLAPASYQVTVQARPWYATASQQQRSTNASRAAAGAPMSSATEPSLDVTYPRTWFPGVDDPTHAETIALSAGDERHADFQLSPIPSLHLQIISPSAQDQTGQRPIRMVPIVEQIDSFGGRVGFQQSVTSSGAQGSIDDVGGLTPGTYRVILQGPGGNSRTTVVQVAPGSSRTIDLREPSSDTANITLLFDGDDDRPMTIELVDTVTRQRYSPFGSGRPLPMNPLRGPQLSQQGQPGRNLTLPVPPGRYELLVQSRSDTFLTGITAQGADVSGRFITVHGGDITLTLHTSRDPATVTGTVTNHGKPCAGAVVMLVPAGLDDPNSFTTLARDQSNTDGSFDLEGLVPGQYILIAVDHGWHINWSDPATLRGYLTHGTPLDLGKGKNIRQNIEAQTP